MSFLGVRTPTPPRPTPTPTSTPVGPTAPQQCEVTDTAAPRRLETLLDQAMKEAQHRGALSGIHASARSWKNTFSLDTAATASFVLNKGTALVIALVVAPLIVVSIGTFGALPVAAAITAILAAATTKLIGIAVHARDVNAMLKLMSSATDPDDDLEIDWAKAKPNIDGSARAATIDMADKLLPKLASDVKKLDTELDAILTEKKIAKTQANRTALVASLLKGEMDAVGDAQRAANTTGWLRPHSNQTLVVTLHTLSAKSKTIANKTDRAVHRLRRIRFYLRWMSDYMKALEGAAYDAVDVAQKAETTLMGGAFLQVHLKGNHASCGKICFGPADADITTGPATAVPPNARFAHLQGGKIVLPTKTAASTGLSGVAPPTSAEKSKAKKEEIFDKIVDKAIDKLVTDRASDAVSSLVTGATGVAALGDWTGGFVGDTIGAAVGQARATFRVNRPLAKRVAMVRTAMLANADDNIDDAIDKLAKKNDLKAVLRAFVKVQNHYPKTIKTRLDKLTAEMRRLEPIVGSKGDSASPFANCAEAGKAMRYLFKVYHVSEKQLIHVLFVKYAVEALDNQVFREGYKRIRKEVHDELIGFNKETLKHVETRLPQDDLVLLIGAAKRKLQAASTRRGDPLAAQREFHEALKEAMGLAAVLTKSYVNLAAFRNDAFKTSIQKVGLDGAVLSMKDFQTVSNVRFQARSKATVVVDTALDQYEKATNPTLGRYLNIERSRVMFDRIVRDTENRTRALRGLRTECENWINGKAESATSSRRPALLQLLHCATIEQTALTGLTDVFKQLAKDGTELGLLS